MIVAWTAQGAAPAEEHAGSLNHAETAAAAEFEATMFKGMSVKDTIKNITKLLQEPVRVGGASARPSNTALAHKNRTSNSRQTTLRRNLKPHDTKLPLFSLKCLDTGSGWKIPAIWYGAGANPVVFIPET